MVDLAAMRDALAKQGVDPNLVNPRCPTDLIVDHSLQIDYKQMVRVNAKAKGRIKGSVYVLKPNNYNININNDYG